MNLTLTIVVLVLMLYIPVSALIALIVALCTRKKDTASFQRTFRSVFWDFFSELLNPFSWF